MQFHFDGSSGPISCEGEPGTAAPSDRKMQLLNSLYVTLPESRLEAKVTGNVLLRVRKTSQCPTMPPPKSCTRAPNSPASSR